MAIQNPTITTPDVANFRRPETGDPRALARGVGQIADVVVEGIKDWNENKLVDELEAERQQFLNQQVDVSATMAEAEDAFTGFTGENPPTDKDLQNFADKMMRLTRAQKSGQISEAELKIRQEAILREHMARKPWMADELLQAASRSQGYNPIGSAVEAVIASQETEAKATRALWDKINNQMIQAGTPAYLLASNPVEFYRQGAALIGSAQKLQLLRDAAETGELEDKIMDKAVKDAFEETMSEGFLGTLNARVVNYIDKVNSVSVEMYANNPETQAMLDREKLAIASSYRTGGDNWKKMYAKARELVPSMTVSDFNRVYDTTVKPYFDMMADARTPEESRAHVNFYADPEYRAMILRNPQLGLNLAIVKALEGTKDTPEALALNRDVVNNITLDLGRVWSNQGGYISSSGESLPHPGTRPGRDQDIAGNGQVGEGSRGFVLNAATGLLDDVLDPKPRDLKGSSQQALANLSDLAQTTTWLRGEGVNRPSNAYIDRYLTTIASPGVKKALESVEPSYAMRASSHIRRELEEMTQDMAYNARMEMPKLGSDFSWRNAEYLDVWVDSSGPRLVVKNDAPPLVKRQADLLVAAFNRNYGQKFGRALAAFVNISEGDKAYNLNSDVIYASVRASMMKGLGLL